MPRNVEIKARVSDAAKMEEKVFELTESLGLVFKQEDVFFRVPNGRLKLRIVDSNEDGELIFYERPDNQGPKTSNYSKTIVTEPQQLKETLSQALGVVGIVRKTRRLYMLGQTRIHLDNVEGLGAFLELEVQLEDNETTENGQSVAEAIMQKLGISDQSLVAGAYMDLLNSR